MNRNRNKLIWLVWIGFLVPAFGVPDPEVAQRGPSLPEDVVRLPVVEGRDIRFRKLSNSQNLSHVRVESIVQDAQGFMWFGTGNGLNRYDGYKFKLFKHEAGDPQSLSGVHISSLFKDHSGSLWVGTDGFIDRFEPASETFRHYRLDQLPANSLSKAVTHISEDSKGTLWLSTPNGLLSLDPNHGRMKRYSHDPTDQFSLADSEIKSSGEDREGNFWVATRTSLDEFDRETGRVARHIPVDDSGVGLWFHEDRLGAFWIVYGSLGRVATLDRKKGRLTRYECRWVIRPTQTTHAYAMLEDVDGTMWFATGSGVMRFDRQNHRFVGYHRDYTDPETINDNHVIALFEDRESNIWTGLYQEPPDYFPTRPPPFESLSRLTLPIQHELSGLITAIYEDGRDQVWVGASRRLYHINRKTGQIWPFEGVDDSEVNSIISDGPDALWFGNAYPGLLRYNTKSGERRGYRHNRADPTTLCSGVIYHLLIDRVGVLWSATWNGVCRFDSSSGRFSTYIPGPGSRSLNYYAIAQGTDGALWLGGNAGLHRFDPQTKTFTVYAHNPEDPTSISNDHVNAVFFDRAGTLWAGTQNGLDRFDPIAHSFKSYDQRNGMSGAVVSCILQDGGGKLWMSTNKGISSFEMVSEHFANYTAADGLPGSDLTGTGACYESSRGEMFFAGFSGATAFFPSKMVENPYVPQPVLTDFRLFGSSVVPGRRSPLKKAINWTRSIQLSHSETVLSIEFSALSYLSPETNRYRYKLDGIDRGWREVGSDERLASYTTLPAGNHSFRLEAATSRGPWSPDVVLQIEILPPFWKTYWFITFLVAVLCAVLGLIYRLRLNRLSAQFDLRIEERLAERTRIARELHDTLLQSFQGSVFEVQAARKLFLRSPDDAMQSLDEAIRSAEAAIVEGRDAILDLRSGAAARSDLAHLFAAAGPELSGVAVSNGGRPAFQVTVEGKPRELETVLQDEVYRIGREILRNAFRHAQAKEIEVEIRYDPQELRIRFRDDGIGIDPGVLNEGARAGHWGLPGVRERAELAGAQLDLWSESGAGTEIQVIVQASVAYAKSPDSRIFGIFRKRSTSHGE